MFSQILLVTRSPFGCCWPSPAASGAATPARSPTPGRRAAGARSTWATLRRCSAVPWQHRGKETENDAFPRQPMENTHGKRMENLWKIHGNADFGSKELCKNLGKPKFSRKTEHTLRDFLPVQIENKQGLHRRNGRTWKICGIWQKKWRIEEPPLVFISVI